MPIANTSYKGTVTELAQPHRYDWVAECHGNPPCGWHSHVFHSQAKPGDTVDAHHDAVETIIFHMMAKHHYTRQQAEASVTVKPLKEPAAKVPFVPDVPAKTDASRTHAVTKPPVVPAK